MYNGADGEDGTSGSGNVDLSNYYTKAETNTAINNAKPDLSQYASLSYANSLFYSSLRMKRLWVNADSESEVGAHSMEVDWVSDYEQFLIVYRVTTTSTNRISVIFRRGDSCAVYALLNLSSNYTVEMVQRITTVSVNGNITYGDASSKNVGATSATTNNKRLIPIEIYGIKGVTE